MAEAMEKVIEFFRAKEWSFELDEENQLVRSGISGDNGEWKIVISPSDEDEVCLMLSVFPQRCPEHRRAACAELLTRINYGMLVGCFEMDFENGKINFKTSHPFAQGQFDTELLAKVVSFNLNRMDKFLPAIMSVIYAGTFPAKALAQLQRQEARAKVKQGAPKSPARHRRFLNN
jgi:hypothetical protein